MAVTQTNEALAGSNRSEVLQRSDAVAERFLPRRDAANP